MLSLFLQNYTVLYLFTCQSIYFLHTICGFCIPYVD
nr:MAG TPA: Thioredoxin-like [Caudoviricetes sp.]